MGIEGVARRYMVYKYKMINYYISYAELLHSSIGEAWLHTARCECVCLKHQHTAS